MHYPICAHSEALVSECFMSSSVLRWQSPEFRAGAELHDRAVFRSHLQANASPTRTLLAFAKKLYGYGRSQDRSGNSRPPLRLPPCPAPTNDRTPDPASTAARRSDNAALRPRSGNASGRQHDSRAPSRIIDAAPSCLVSRRTGRRPLRTRSTVATLTPGCTARSWIVGRLATAFLQVNYLEYKK